MNKVWFALIGAMVLIAAVMMFLVMKGVGLRAAPLIRPSLMDADLQIVASSTVSRLYPELQKTPLIVLGVLPLNERRQLLLKQLTEAFKKTFQKEPGQLDLSTAPAGGESITDQLAACPRPCWILGPLMEANELAGTTSSNQGLMEVRAALQNSGEVYFNLSAIDFDRVVETPVDCLDEKRLSYRCLAPLVVHDSLRKMKDAVAKYFFLRKYNERDYFLFLEN